MFETDSFILLSCLLFCIGLVGAFRQNDLLKTFISIEIAVCASIVNFAHFPVNQPVSSEHIIILVSVILGCLTFSIIFMIIYNVALIR
jgi:NADH:ubiquinone oxidoreductase subunit K